MDAHTFKEHSARCTLLDVRTPEEYAEGHIAGAKNIVWNPESFEAQVCDLPKDSACAVYCRSGGRSAQARVFLLALGFSDVEELSGGILAWEKAGFPVER